MKTCLHLFRAGGRRPVKLPAKPTKFRRVVHSAYLFVLLAAPMNGLAIERTVGRSVLAVATIGAGRFAAGEGRGGTGLTPATDGAGYP